MSEIVQALEKVHIVIFGTLTCCALLHSIWNFKAAQMNMHYSLIGELILYVGHDAAAVQPKIFLAQKVKAKALLISVW